MSLKSKLIEKALAELVDELPERHPDVQARLDNPALRRVPETTRLLQVFDLLLDAPFAKGQFEPIMRRIVQDAALLCEFGSPDGEAQRVWARDFLAKLRDVVAPVGSLNDVFPGRVPATATTEFPHDPARFKACVEGGGCGHDGRPRA